MNANTLLAFLAALFAAGAAAAQQLPRKPPSAFGSLRTGLPETPPVAQPPVPPLVLSAAVVEDVPAFNSESAKMFTGRVQPILANACAGCHARRDHASRFKLRHTSSEFVDTEAATANLHAAARMVSRDRPAESLFLTKASTAHGGAKEPPLRSRAIPAFRYLELWAHWAAAPEGAPMPEVSPTAPAPVVASLPTAAPSSMTQLTGGTKEPPPLPEPAGPPAGGVTHLTLGPKEPGKLPPLPKAEPISPVSQPGGFATGPREPTAIQPTSAKPNPTDEFDPTAFNRAAHPARK